MFLVENLDMVPVPCQEWLCFLKGDVHGRSALQSVLVCLLLCDLIPIPALHFLPSQTSLPLGQGQLPHICRWQVSIFPSVFCKLQWIPWHLLLLHVDHCAPFLDASGILLAFLYWLGNFSSPFSWVEIPLCVSELLLRKSYIHLHYFIQCDYL